MRWLPILVLLILAGCGSDSPVGAGIDSDEPTLGSGEPAGLSIEAAETSFDAIGDFTIWNVTTVDDAGNAIASGPYEWTLPDESVVGLSSSGQGNTRATIWSTGNGTVTITVSDRTSGLTASQSVTVEQQLAQLVSSVGRRMLEFPGDILSIPLLPADRLNNPMADVAVEWESADPGIVLVDDTGVITAVDFGSAELAVRGGGFEETVNVQVAGDRFFLSGDTPLRYDLDLPPGPGPFPAVVWVHGSGEMTRDTQKGATDPLVPEGVAVLRYDKRGVGESGGVYFGISPGNSANGLGQLAADASAAVDFLSNFPEVDMNRVGLAANSQGGWISPLAASNNSEIDFMLIWSGPTVSVGLEIYYSNLTNSGASLEAAYAQLSSFNGNPGYDPLPVLQSIDIPSLWLFGQEDRSIPVRIDIENMNQLRSEALPYDYIVYPNAGHDLRDLTSRQFNDVWGDWLGWLRGEDIL